MPHPMTLPGENLEALPEWDWEAARQRKLVVGLAATPAQRFAWLESMIALAWSSGALPRLRPDPWGTCRPKPAGDGP